MRRIYYYMEYNLGIKDYPSSFNVAGYSDVGVDEKEEILPLRITYCSDPDRYAIGSCHTFLYKNFRVCKSYSTMEELVNKHMLEML